MKGKQHEVDAYKQVQKNRLPRKPILRNVVLAFLVGGAITTVGQLILMWFVGQGMSLEKASTPTAAVMVFIGALLTGLGWYDEIARYGGMGAALPITGFANSIVAPAMEFKREGWILGVGARMFTVAGPVIVYGLVTSIAVGLVYYYLYGPR